MCVCVCVCPCVCVSVPKDSVCPRECVRARYLFGIRLSRCPRASCLPSIAAGVGVVSAQQRTSTRSHVYRSALGGSGTRSDMRGHTHASHTAHPSISRPSTSQSIEAFFHPSVRVTLAFGIPNDRARSRASIHAWQRRYVGACAHPILYHVCPRA